jgi:hypothetical protein
MGQAAGSEYHCRILKMKFIFNEKGTTTEHQRNRKAAVRLSVRAVRAL